MAQVPLNCSPYVGDIALQSMEPLQRPVPVLHVALGPQPCSVTCPSCGASVITSVVSKTTTKTHLIALLLCCLGCILCMCCPYCMDSCQNADHICPNCDAYLGTYKR